MGEDYRSCTTPVVINPFVVLRVDPERGIVVVSDHPNRLAAESRIAAVGQEGEQFAIYSRISNHTTNYAVQVQKMAVVR